MPWGEEKRRQKEHSFPDHSFNSHLFRCLLAPLSWALGDLRPMMVCGMALGGSSKYQELLEDLASLG